MKSKVGFLAMIAIAAGALVGAASGCELVAGVDRTKIETGGAGGSAGTAGMGGTTTNPTTGGSAGTTAGSAGSGGAMCTDPATDCPAPSGECKVYSCDAMGMCVEGDVADGMDAATQVAGDCKKNVCMTGAVTPQDDNADVGDDGNDCTIDSCDMGAPKTDPAAAGTMCAAGVCDGNGTCVECNDDADCKVPLKPYCISNTCVAATCMDGKKNGDETDQDCGGSCATCADGKACLAASDCDSGVCTGNVCQVPTCNDGVANGMETDKDCGGGTCPKCKSTEKCNVDGDCVGGQCSGMGGTCTPNCQDTEKNGSETDVDCGGGTCGTCADGKNCNNSDANCAATSFCNMQSVCTADKPNGQNCMGNSQCVSGACADGVCCDGACGGTCAACDLAGTVGTCTPIPLGQDPANECAGTDVCDGNGACAKPNGQMCGMGAECASGQCVDGVCCENACAGACKACSAAKTGGADGVCGNVTMGTDPDSECTGNLNCNGSGACESLKANGAACAAAAECTSGFCTDGVCCNSTCGGTCRACNLAGSMGTCAFHPVGSDPENDCAGSLSCASGGTCQTPFANGTACTVNGECSSGMCVDGFCCNSACSGLCQACSAAKTGGANGTCGNVTPGTDPDNECMGAGMDNCAAGAMCGP